MHRVHYRLKYKFPCHVAMHHFMHALCALAMFLVYKFSFHPLTRTQMCFAVNLNFPQTKLPSIRYIIHYSEESKMKTSYIHVHTLLNYSAENVTFCVDHCFLAEKNFSLMSIFKLSFGNSNVIIMLVLVKH